MNYADLIAASIAIVSIVINVLLGAEIRDLKDLCKEREMIIRKLRGLTDDENSTN